MLTILRVCRPQNVPGSALQEIKDPRDAILSRGSFRLVDILLRQVKVFDQENGHRVTLDRGTRAVQADAAAAGDPVRDQLLDEVRTE